MDRPPSVITLLSARGADNLRRANGRLYRMASVSWRRSDWWRGRAVNSSWSPVGPPGRARHCHVVREQLALVPIVRSGRAMAQRYRPEAASPQSQTQFDSVVGCRADSDSAATTASRCYRCRHDGCLGDGCWPGSDGLGYDGGLGDRVADDASSSSTRCSNWHLRLLHRWCRYQPRSRQ